MSRWWENERSVAAARIRATRRRLRASYKASLAAAVVRERSKLEHEYRQKAVVLADAERIARQAAAEMSRPEVFAIDYQMQKRIGCEITIHRDLFLRVRNPSEMIEAVCQMIGRAVEGAAYKFARNERRPFAPPLRRPEKVAWVESDSNSLDFRS